MFVQRIADEMPTSRLVVDQEEGMRRVRLLETLCGMYEEQEKGVDVCWTGEKQV
jgi:hypothetical protein